MRKVYGTSIASRGQSINWSSFFRHAAPPSGSFRFRLLQRLRKSRITRERWQLDEKHLQNADSKPGSAYRMVKLFPPRGATYLRFPLAVRLNDNENRDILENGGSWLRNVYRLPIGNQGRPLEWSRCFYYASPPSGYFRFRSVLETTIISNNSRSVAAGREM
jgi:hypothetical protein